MLGNITITFHGPMASRQPVAEVRAIKKDVLEQVCHRWHQQYYELHFLAEGARRYRYARRFTKEVTSGSIRRGKKGGKRAPSGRPLHWTGRSYERGKAYTVSATPTVGKVRMNMPALNFKPKYNPIDLRKELETVTQQELQQLRAYAAEQAQMHAKRMNTRRVRVTFTV